MAIPHPRFCACCTPAVAPAPSIIWNRPGLKQITYRIGSFATFRQAMLGEIHRFPELTGLLTRESDDHAITFLELFAAMGDVLTFYNERIANEMFLSQALHKASVEQLVALVGYIPRPALSATGLLSFEIEEDKATRLWKGLKVMSIPGPDETAQVFETLEEIRGVGRLNAAPAFAPFVRINPLDEGRQRAPVRADPDLKVGDRFVLFGRGAIEEKTVEAVENSSGGAYLSWSPAVQNPDIHPRFVRAAGSLRRLRFFGHNAPASHNVYDTRNTTPPQNRWSTDPINGEIGNSVTDYPLDTKVDDLKPGAHLLLDAGPTASPRLQTALVTATNDASATLGPMSDTVTHMQVRQTITGRPTVMVRATGTPSVLARTGGGYPSWTVSDIATPNDLSLMDGAPFFASSDLAGTSRGWPRTDVFVRDAARRLRQRVWSPFPASGWIDHGGILTSAPVPITLATGRVLVFVRGPAAGLWMFDATGTVMAPTPLGGILASPPSVVTPDGIRMAVFVRGIDDALWWRRFNGLTWSDWESLGGRIDGTPAAAANGAGRIDVFARGLEGGIQHFRQGPTGWEPVRDVGGDAVGNPAAVGGAPDWAAVAVRTRDSTLAFTTRIGETWGSWVDQGGSIGSDPSMVQTPSGVHVAARHSDGTVTTTRLSWTPPPWVHHGSGFGYIPDRRETRIYEIASDDVEFRDYDYPDTTEGGWLALPLEPGEDATDPDGLGALKKGRKIIVSGGGLTHRAEVTATFPVPATLGGRVDHLALGISPPLPKVDGPLTLIGNVAEASHGETQREDPLGSGDAAKPFQTFAVPPGEITHLPDAGGVRPIPQVDLRVNGVLWEEVPFLYGRDVKDRTYTLRLPTDGDVTVTGGDGIRAGARFPTGALNVRMIRRLGAGLPGNLKAGQLAVPLEKPVGMKTVTNPLPSSGGAPGETAEDARQAAPDGVRTFGRIVSLQDFAALATASGLAARAYVTWVWNRMERTAHLTVAGPEGMPVSPENLALLHTQLTASRDPNRPLMIANMVRVPIVLAAKLLRDPAHEADAVIAAARDAMTTAFAFEGVGIGRPVHLSDAFAVLQGVAGVQAVDIDLLHLKDHADLSGAERAVRSVTADPVQPHIRLYPARPTPDDATKIDRYQSDAYLPGPPPVVLPAEQAYIADPAFDLSLTVVEAL
ncbi:hypothetical protein [Aliiroseovarius sp. YM-037]|uniref:hypothetical protein n=1 Tax=Aliiroseovarius sp. YM-037 TaxID=3341728 RepID=UPI003A813456